MHSTMNSQTRVKALGLQDRGLSPCSVPSACQLLRDCVTDMPPQPHPYPVPLSEPSGCSKCHADLLSSALQFFHSGP